MPRFAPTARAGFALAAALLLTLTAFPAAAQQEAPPDRADQLRQRREAEMRARMEERRQEIQASENLSLMGRWDGGNCTSIAIRRASLALCGSNEHLSVLDVSLVSDPVEQSRMLLPGSVEGIAIRDNYAYVANGEGGVRVIDVSSLTSPQEVGFYGTDRNAQDVASDGGYLYVIFSGELLVIDVSDPTNLQEVAALDIASGGDIKVRDGYAYVTNLTSGMQVIDISTPSSPEEVSFFEIVDATGLNAQGLSLKDRYTYVASGRFGLSVIDVSDPTNPQGSGFFNTNATEFVRDVSVAGSFAYMTDQANGLRVVNISDP